MNWLRFFFPTRRRLRRPKVQRAQRVEIIYSDGRPDLHMTMSQHAWDLLSFAYAMEAEVAVVQVDNTVDPVIVDLRHIVAITPKPVEVLER